MELFGEKYGKKTLKNGKVMDLLENNMGFCCFLRNHSLKNWMWMGLEWDH